MKTSWSLLLILIFLSSAARGSDERQLFRQAFQSSATTVVPFSETEQAHLNQFEYIFVGGLLNEAICGYFEDNQAALTKLGVRKDQIHTLHPTSTRSAWANSAPLTQALFERAKKRKLVITAHSKGGVETLAAILGSFELLRDRIESVILVQSPLGGSRIADYLQKMAPEPTHRMPAYYRAQFHLMAQAQVILLPLFQRGLGSLTRKSTTELWQSLLRPIGTAHRNLIDRKLKYVVTAKHPSAMAPLLQAAGWYIRSDFGINDGLIEMKDQSLPGLGSVLLELYDSDHTDLTTTWPYSGTGAQRRQALSYATLKLVLSTSKPSAVSF